jgi:hypothetical protein
MHVISLDPSNVFNPVHPPLPVTASSLRRFRVAGALPFPHQQQPSHLHRHVASASEMQDNHNARCNSGSVAKPVLAFDALGGGVLRPIDIGILPRGTSGAENLWSLPSMVGGIAETDKNKKKENSTNGEVLILKQPPVTTVQPFAYEKPQNKNVGKPTLRPSTYK